MDEELMPYRKKAKKNTPKKTKHKHEYQFCVIEFDVPKHPWRNKPEINGYCPICGKVGFGELDTSIWWTSVMCEYGFSHERTDAAIRELDPKTRTLPTFHSKEVFPKFVDLKEVEQHGMECILPRLERQKNCTL